MEINMKLKKNTIPALFLGIFITALVMPSVTIQKNEETVGYSVGFTKVEAHKKKASSPPDTSQTKTSDKKTSDKKTSDKSPSNTDKNNKVATPIAKYSAPGQKGIVTGNNFNNFSTGRDMLVYSSEDMAQASANMARSTFGYSSTYVYALRNIETGQIVGYVGGARHNTVVLTSDSDSDRDRDRNSDTPPPDTPPPSSCSDGYPNIVIDDVYFVKAQGDNSTAMDQSQMLAGVEYVPIAVIRNDGCRSTAADDRHKDERPFGENGSFPVRLSLDLNNNGSEDAVQYKQSIGPLDSQEVVFLSMGSIVAPDAAEHLLEVTVDVTEAEAPGNGCTGDWGCVLEQGTPVTNTRTESFTTVQPNIDLGSYMYVSDDRKAYGASTLNERDITSEPTNSDVGLYWDGTYVRYNTCTGKAVDQDGVETNDFTGQKDYQEISNSPSNDNRNDVRITEPAPGSYHVYTIECTTDFGTKVSDILVVLNDTDADDLVFLSVEIDNITMGATDNLNTVRFATTNGLSTPANGYTYEISVDDKRIGLDTASIPANEVVPVDGAVTYTAPATPTDPPHLPLKVCLSHPDMPSNVCDTATLRIVAPECSDTADNDIDLLIDAADSGCWTDPEDSSTYDPMDPSETNIVASPTITATPALVRRNQPVTLTWDPMGNSGCTLSPNNNGALDVSTAGGGEVSVTNETTFIMTCDRGQEDQVTVKVLPLLYES
jgi:hypothetical protein